MHTYSSVTQDHLFSTFKGSRLLNILPTNFSPGLAISPLCRIQSTMIFTSKQVQGRHSHGCITLIIVRGTWCTLVRIKAVILISMYATSPVRSMKWIEFSVWLRTVYADTSTWVECRSTHMNSRIVIHALVHPVSMVRVCGTIFKLGDVKALYIMCIFCFGM